ncbi:alpha/beta fold hydrolase [bacterium]|nr:alpha/beta fold hydrolase [bacterium]
MHHALAKTGDFRVITPDLPGFEGSTRTIKDYSFASHASYVEALLDSLAIPSAHVIGYSMSGGVVAEMMHFRPDLLKSVVMLSAIGVEEVELMGDFYLNRSIHALQYGFIWSLTELVPHFGFMDSFILGVPYARNFFDSDQRPLRNYLREYTNPALIIHGDRDPLVPFSAALEHFRLIPQSKLIVFDNQGHGIPFERPEMAADSVLTWVQSVEEGKATLKANATVERIEKANKPFDATELPPLEGMALYLLLAIIAASTLLSEDLAAIGAGLMVARGSLEFEVALAAAFAGIFAGDVLLYVAGRSLGSRIVSLPPFSWFIRPEQLERGKKWFHKEGAKVVLISRVLPGSRFPTYVAAGILKAPFGKFIGLFLIGTIIWTPLIVGVSTVMGNQILAFWSVYESYALWVVLGLFAVVYSIFHVGIPLWSHNGRQRLKASWARKIRWEFWPPFVFYPPLLVYIAYLAIKHRSLMAFTAVNPGIPEGGFVGESKSAILDLLSDSPLQVARHILVSESSTAPREILEFMTQETIEFPIVLKPDIGERGHGVVIATSQKDIAHYFELNHGPIIAQEYIGGEEFGVFYIKHPTEGSGSIFSVTVKQMLAVTGDGIHSLERLILDHPRARLMYRMFERRYGARLDEIIRLGESFPLVEVGTHARGATFLDGTHLISEELESLFGSIVTKANGFYFGRFDVKAPSANDLMKGKNIKILELNGVTSEATHIYDPSSTLMSAYRTLMRQWDLAFTIGTFNVKNGHKPAKLSTLIGSIYSFKIRPERRPDVSESARL